MLEHPRFAANDDTVPLGGGGVLSPNCVAQAKHIFVAESLDGDMQTAAIGRPWGMSTTTSFRPIYTLRGNPPETLSNVGYTSARWERKPHTGELLLVLLGGAVTDTTYYYVIQPLLPSETNINSVASLILLEDSFTANPNQTTWVSYLAKYTELLGRKVVDSEVIYQLSYLQSAFTQGAKHEVADYLSPQIMRLLQEHLIPYEHMYMWSIIEQANYQRSRNRHALATSLEAYYNFLRRESPDTPIAKSRMRDIISAMGHSS